MLRHTCGFKLANDGVDTRALQHFMGHRNIMHTVRDIPSSAPTASMGSGRIEPRCAVPECHGISHADPIFREALWDRFFTAAPRPRTPSELLYSDRRLRSKSSPAATILIRKR